MKNSFNILIKELRSACHVDADLEYRITRGTIAITSFVRDRIKGLWSACHVQANLEYRITEGTVTIIRFVGAGQTATIPGTIKGLPVTRIGNGAFRECASLTSISISNNVNAIGDGAFSFCTSLTGITIPDSVTSIGRGTFSNCSALTSVTIGSKVTEIPAGAFYGCTSLAGVMIPETVIEIMPFSFVGCTSLNDITVAALNSSYSSTDGILFDKGRTVLLCCPQGKAGMYNVPDGVTRIRAGAFDCCSRLTGIKIPDSVTHIEDSAFRNCASLTNVTIGNSNTKMGEEVFTGCRHLTHVTIGTRIRSLPELTSFDTVERARVATISSLLKGDAAFLHTFGDGAYICGMDTDTGLPVRLCGDIVDMKLSREVRGHNQGVRDFIQQYGLPWNSRLPWIKEIQKPGTYFSDRRQKAKWFRLILNGAAAQSDDKATLISLRSLGGISTAVLRVSSTKYWSRMQHSRSAQVAEPASLPVPSQPCAEQPVIRDIRLWIHDRAQECDLLWGPEGSELVFFRFGSKSFGVLDLPLGEWLC